MTRSTEVTARSDYWGAAEEPAVLYTGSLGVST